MTTDVLLVGCGRMGGALAEGWRDASICKQLIVVDPASSGLKSLQDIPSGFRPQVIVFAVKPQTLPDIISGYMAFTDALFISIAAGKPIAFFEKHLGAKARIVRSMPNLPASIAQGITVACANKNAGAADKDTAAQLLGAVGDVLWVEKEALLDPVTALSGSGPAYIFLLIEVLAKAGVHIGLDPVMAQKLARQTVTGSAALAAESPGMTAETLRQNVTSPGGTTEAALKVLMAQPGMQELFDRALAAAAKRAQELSI